MNKTNCLVKERPVLTTGINVTNVPLLLRSIHDDSVSTLNEVIGRQPSVFILLRHFAWLPWRRHVKQIEEHKVITIDTVIGKCVFYIVSSPMVQASFASFNCNIHVVSFCSRQVTLQWKEETSCQFPVWTDPNRQLYEALDFKRSMFQVSCSFGYW